MTKNKKIALYGNIMFGVLILIASAVFIETSLNKYITKTIASALFVLCGVFNFILLHKYNKTNGYLKSVILLVGLVFAMVGDILLIENSLFIYGAISFAVGHVFFLIYFCTLFKINWVDLIVFAALITFAMLIIFLYPHFNFNGMKMLVVVYAVVISAMLAKSIGNFINNKSKSSLITMLGAILFFFSDMMLLFYVFGGGNIIFDYFCIYTYYPAEFLLALSLLLNKNNYSKNVEYK